MIKILSILFLFSFSFGYSQSKCDQVLLTGRVEDSLNPQSFYNLMIVNRTRGKGFFGQPNGYFSVYVNEGDSISISIKGYPMIGFRIHADENCQFKFHKFIELKATEMKEVVIKPLKTLNQIKEERQELSMRETRQVTGIDMLQSPITALYQTFSKKEKNKKWIAEQEFKDNERKVVQELLRLYVAYDIINLSEEEFDEFIVFLNINETFLKTATEMELITFVQDKFEHFKRLNSITVEENYIWKSQLDKNNKKQALIDLLKLFVAHELINLPEIEFDRFIEFMKLDDSFLKNANESELIKFVQEKYTKYITFYKLNFDSFIIDYHISDIDNYKWKSDLACQNNKKEAISELLRLYIEHHVIDLEVSELERFTRFLNIDESFMKSSSDSELIYFVQEKYKKYRQFYKIK
jgi:hypothetical protein